MKNKKMISVVAAIIAVVAIGAVFYVFTTKPKTTSQQIVYNLGADPATIDTCLANAVDAANVITATFEGLTRIQPDQKPGPGVAKTWDLSADGKVYTFHLRDDAKWSDGKAVTANDFYFAWTRLLNPATAADYSFQLFYVKNAENYFNKKAKLSDVGLKVVDEKTFEVTLNAPVPYFLELCAWAQLAPERADIVNANPKTWANNVDTYIGNGPFKLISWKHTNSMEFVKNENYWDKANIKIDKMKWTMIVEASSAIMAWEKGDVDIIETIPVADIPAMIKSKKLTIAPYLGSYCLYVNTKKAPFDNIKFRKALNLAIDRSVITDTILKAGQIPAGAWVPKGLLEPSGKDFRDYKPEYFKATGDIAEAKKLLLESGVDTSKLTVEFLYNTSEAHKMIAEAIQSMWKTNLGINVKLANQEWSVFQATRKSGNYMIARAGWIGDYSDPMTFLDMFTSTSGQNDIKYTNPAYDALILQAKNTADPEARMAVMHKAEDMLMNDMPIIPIYYYVNTIAINPRIKGFYKTITGPLYFDKAYIEEVK
jgi:oligopeptide transport system substrate-binding protein